MPARPGTQAPRLPHLRFGALSADETRAFVDSEGDDLEQVTVTDVEVVDLQWEVRRRLADSQVRGVRCQVWKAPALSLNGCRLEQLDVVALSAPNAGWSNTEIATSRIGSIEAFDANLRQVAFVGCKLGYVNLRGADLADVSFTDCVIEDLDLSRAQVKRVSLSGCRITRLELSNSTLRDVDVRGAQLGDVPNPEGLRGATISADQLFDLAPMMAARLGLIVE